MTESSLAAIGALEKSEGYQALLALLESELETEISQLLEADEPSAILAKQASASALRRVIAGIRFRVSRYASEYSTAAYPDPVGT